MFDVKQVKRWLRASASILIAAAPSVAMGKASSDDDAKAALEDIVVTARKTSENLQKAPATINVVNAEQLTSGGIEKPTDLNKVLPSASLRSQGPVAQTYIRGVGSNLDFPWTSPASIITYNGVIIPRYGTKGVLFDLSRVEQIAGPQGTLYGGSAAGGAINLITQKPAGEFSGNALLEGGNYGTVHGALNQNIPLSDTFSMRTSVDYSRHSPYTAGQFFSSDKLEGRQSFLWTPSNDFSVLVFASGYREKGIPPAALQVNADPTPKNPFNAVPSAFPNGTPINGIFNFQNSRTYVVGSNIEWHVGDAVLSYIPAYVHVKSDYAFYLQGGVLDIRDQEDQFSQELRLNQSFGRLKLGAGLFWLTNKIDFNDGINLPVLPAAAGYYLRVPVNRAHQTNTSYSAFAQAVYSVTDQLRLTAGGRISRDKIVASGFGLDPFFTPRPFTFRRGQSTGDWKVGVDFDLAPRILLYANIQTGYIPFGYSPDSGNPAPELPRSKLLAYSGGFKARFLENRVEVNNESFYYDYKNFQAFAFDQTTFLTVAAGAKKSRIFGNELTVRWLFSDKTKLDAAVVWQDAKYTNFVGPGFNYSGFRMANAPVLSIIGGLQHELDLGDHGSLLGRVQSQYNSGFWGQFSHNGTFQRRYARADLSLTYSFPQSDLKVQAYVDNVTNKAVFTGLGANSTPGGSGVGFLDAPRTYGVRVSTSWK